MSLEDKAVLITGASRGIGREVACGFAAAGARLALTWCSDRAGGEAAAVAALERGAPEAFALQLDVRDDDSVRRAVAAAADRLGGLDVLVNNAGVVVWKLFAEQSFAEIEEQVAVNLVGVMKVTRAALPHLRDAVITVASTAGLHATPRLSAYGAGKWGVRGFVKVLARERPDLRVVSVHPTVTATRMNDFQGMPPAEVAGVVLRVARGEISFEPGADVDVRDFVER